ncbi:MAG: Rab family GTPase [Raineya sp.]|nr:GTP-binding protein [Raineya sp.]MDW8297347.1 Rab family GTPase [Raineya sp.]
MNTGKTYSKKVILIGNFGVGKTSLTKRFVYQKFSEEYLTTLGVKIDKKIIELGEDLINLMIWDIAGEVTQTRVNTSYYLGSNGVLYVFDVTRPSTYENMQADIEYVQKILPNVPILKIANKADLISPEQLKQLPVSYDFLCSAKTGENVENAFLALAQAMIEKSKV